VLHLGWMMYFLYICRVPVCSNATCWLHTLVSYYKSKKTNHNARRTPKCSISSINSLACSGENSSKYCKNEKMEPTSRRIEANISLRVVNELPIRKADIFTISCKNCQDGCTSYLITGSIRVKGDERQENNLQNLIMAMTCMYVQHMHLSWDNKWMVIVTYHVAQDQQRNVNDLRLLCPECSLEGSQWKHLQFWIRLQLFESPLRRLSEE